MCLTCLTCLTRWGRHVIPRGFAVPQFGLARVQIYCGDNAMGRFTVGVKLCLLDGNGGVRVAGA